MHNSGKAIAASLGIGMIAGLRSMSAPAVVSWAAHQQWISPRGRSLKLLRSSRLAYALTMLAVGELVADKLPGTPNRTEPVGLAARALTGAVSGAALWPKRRGVATGALLGAAGGVAGAFLGYEIRKRLGKRLGVSDTLIAVAEDVIAVAGGVAVVCASKR